MTSRNRLIAVAVLITIAIAAAAAYALAGRSASAGRTAAKSSAGSTVSTAARPSPPAVKSSVTWIPTNPAFADVCRSKPPSQAQDTLGLIAKGGPYPYRSDGIVFENRENRLPRQSTGYYHEFTVVTPGSDDRGTRRIVTGTAGEQYWTGDHYGSFQAIDPRC